MNIQILSGVLVKRETVQTGGGLLTKMVVKTEENYVSKAGEPKTSHTSFDVMCWGNLAQQTENYLEGSWVEVRGRNSHRAFEHQGKKQWKWEMIAAQVTLIVEPPTPPAPAPATPAETPAAEEKKPNLFGGGYGEKGA